jgi:hypothetical protein
MTLPAALLPALATAIGRPVSWDHLVILRNMGSLGQDHISAHGLESRGFHALLLGKAGRATHYLKCRSPSDPNASREANLLLALRDAPASHRLVPHAVEVTLPDVSILALAVVDGPPLGRRVSRAPLAEAISDARACLAARRLLVADLLASGTLGPAASDFDPTAALEPSLTILRERWLEPDVIATILRAMPNVMPSVPQHGDFSPSNVIWSRRGPVFLDFEFFGLVTCPLYDTWHLIKNLREERGEAPHWLDVVAPRNQTDAAWRALINEEAIHLQLTPRQVSGSLLWYLAHFSAFIISLGVAERFTRPCLEDLARAVHLVRGA